MRRFRRLFKEHPFPFAVDRKTGQNHLSFHLFLLLPRGRLRPDAKCSVG